MNRLTKYSNDFIRNKAVNILRKLNNKNKLTDDELALISSFCLIERVENRELKKYEDLEEHGKLLKLPCAVGDTVYVKMQSGEYAEAEVRDFIHFLTCGFCIVVTSEKFDKQNIPFSEFRKSVFLTGEEAEAALKEL